MISFVYFDLGGVVVDDFSGNDKWDQLMQELGVNQTNIKAFDKIWDRYADQFCIDRDIETLVPILRSELGLDLPKGYSLMNGFVSRFYANPLIWPVVQKAQTRAKIGLLTNAYPGMLDVVKQKNILPDIEWNQVIDSSVIRLQKPDKKLYELAEQRAGVPGSQILFVDNSSGHIVAAKEFGWQVYLYDPKNHEQSCKDLSKTLDSLLAG